MGITPYLHNNLASSPGSKENRISRKLKTIIDKLATCLNYYLHEGGGFKYNISIATMVYNEAPYLKEWIEYHKLVGVEKFYIYDNYSTDQIRETLRPYIASGEVEYRLYPEKEEHSMETKKSAYNDMIKRSRNSTKWLLINDVDEFVVPMKGSDILSLIEDIKTKSPYRKVPAIGIFWVLYGYSGNREKPNGGVVENYKKRCSGIKKIGTLPDCLDTVQLLKTEQYKSIVNPRMVVRYHIHGGSYLFNNNTIDELGNKVDRSKASKELIRINHYWTKSYEEFSAKFSKNHAGLYGDGNASSTNSQKYACVPDYNPEFLSDEEDPVMDKYIPSLKKKLERMSDVEDAYL